MSRLRIAIVGMGPKGTYALERLVAHHRETPIPISVTTYEPHPFPGAGPAYDPRQPEYLLMNYPADRIDANWAGPGPPSAYRGGSFLDWSERRLKSRSDLDGGRSGWYPPRATVGEYLSDVHSELVEQAHFPFRSLTEPAEGIELHEGYWSINSATGTRTFDQVLLALGHPPCTARPDPITTEASGTTVAIRGFGLTAIDLILSLTEGRGGRFTRDSLGPLVYQSTANDPAAIVPWTRTGRPMLVKPEVPDNQRTRDLVSSASAEILAIPESETSFERLVDQLIQLASGLLELTTGDPLVDQVRDWFAGARRGRLKAAKDPLESIVGSLQIAGGSRSPDLAWAVGAAWRESYGALVRRFSHGGIDPGSRDDYRRLSAEMERLAFGPPPLNAAKLVALSQAGLLDLSALNRSRHPADLEFDSVIPQPGLDRRPIVTALTDAGLIRVHPGLRGIEVDRASRCVGTDGRPTPGLAACGRITEDWIIGNDSLNRSLHPELNEWARLALGGARSTRPDPTMVAPQ